MTVVGSLDSRGQCGFWRWYLVKFTLAETATVPHLVYASGLPATWFCLGGWVELKPSRRSGQLLIRQAGPGRPLGTRDPVKISFAAKAVLGGQTPLRAWKQNEDAEEFSVEIP